MFIKIHDDTVVALNLHACDSVEIYPRKNEFLLMLSKRLTPEHSEKTTIQHYPSYQDAFADFESMMAALSNGILVWAPQQIEQ